MSTTGVEGNWDVSKASGKRIHLDEKMISALVGIFNYRDMADHTHCLALVKQ